MITFSKQDFEKQYQKIGRIYSPFFNEEIDFNYWGWNHLLKSGEGKPRIEKEFLNRFELLQIACVLLTKKFPPVEYSCRKYSTNFCVEFYSFIYAYCNENNEEYRLKVVIRQKTDTSKHFYSLIKTKHKHFQNKETP